MILLRLASAALLGLLIVLLSGCATLFNNKTPAVDLASTPAGAEVYVDGYYVGTTPVQVNLTVREDHVVEFRKEGHDTRTYRISRFVGFGWIVLDVLTGLVPIIIDLATGDWFMLDTEEVNVALPVKE